jgi:3-phosphoshikimate 1-carboxyvinyltransferase
LTGDVARCHGGGTGALRPFRFDLRHCPDLAPVAAVLALFAPGESRIEGAAHLRWKEVDRIAACVVAVRALGGRARALRDGFSVVGGTPRLGTVDSRGDHRMALAFSVAAAAIPGARVRGVACVGKSWPGGLEAMAPLLRLPERTFRATVPRGG